MSPFITTIVGLFRTLILSKNPQIYTALKMGIYFYVDFY